MEKRLDGNWPAPPTSTLTIKRSLLGGKKSFIKEQIMEYAELLDELKKDIPTLATTSRYPTSYSSS